MAQLRSGIDYFFKTYMAGKKERKMDLDQWCTAQHADFLATKHKTAVDPTVLKVEKVDFAIEASTSKRKIAELKKLKRRLLENRRAVERAMHLKYLLSEQSAPIENSAKFGVNNSRSFDDIIDTYLNRHSDIVSDVAEKLDSKNGPKQHVDFSYLAAGADNDSKNKNRKKAYNTKPIISKITADNEILVYDGALQKDMDSIRTLDTKQQKILNVSHKNAFERSHNLLVSAEHTVKSQTDRVSSASPNKNLNKGDKRSVYYKTEHRKSRAETFRERMAAKRMESEQALTANDSLSPNKNNEEKNVSEIHRKFSLSLQTKISKNRNSTRNNNHKGKTSINKYDSETLSGHLDRDEAIVRRDSRVLFDINAEKALANAVAHREQEEMEKILEDRNHNIETHIANNKYMHNPAPYSVPKKADEHEEQIKRKIEEASKSHKDRVNHLNQKFSNYIERKEAKQKQVDEYMSQNIVSRLNTNKKDVTDTTRYRNIKHLQMQLNEHDCKNVDMPKFDTDRVKRSSRSPNKKNPRYNPDSWGVDTEAISDAITP